MPSDLIIRLPRDPTGVYEAGELDPASGAPAIRRLAPAELAAAAGARRCYALVPGTEVLIVRTRLPTRRRSRIQQALPYALEEHLTGDPEACHFAIQRIDADGSVTAAVVEHGALQGWLAELRELGIEPQGIWPEQGVLRQESGVWRVVADEERALLAYDGEALALETSAAPVALEAALSARPAPRLIRLEAPPTRLTELRGAAAAAEVEVSADDLTEPLLARLLRDAEPRRAMDLLQGAYARQERWGWLWRPLRPAAALLAISVLAETGLQVAELHRLQAEREHLREEIESVYRETFPEGRIVRPRAQMANHLERIRDHDRGGEAGAASLARLLGSSAPTLAADGLSLRALRLRDGALEIDLTAGSIESLERARATIADAEGLEAEIRSAASRDDRVEGRLVVREAA